MHGLQDRGFRYWSELNIAPAASAVSLIRITFLRTSFCVLADETDYISHD